MQTLAPLTFHAVPLKGKFKNMNEVLTIFCAGSDGFNARDRGALFACVVSMFAHWDNFNNTNLEIFYCSHEASARLAYACLFALRKTPNEPKKAELKEVFNRLHIHALAGKPCNLFLSESNIEMLSAPDPDTVFCNIINNFVCLADIIKMVEW
ncbi:hypothetical protein [Desulfovibrio falkowii]|uniref:hypothetical protein n=1 Tax=Desulfovibrio falkowii TaxID=3136602 RepID=UPI0038B2D0FD